MICAVEVENCPEGVKNYKYIIATAIGNTLWYWGATNDSEKAYEMLGNDSYNRIILKNGNVLNKNS